jgi:hypothetical protein
LGIISLILFPGNFLPIFYSCNNAPEISSHEIHVDVWLHSKEFANITGADGANAIGRLKNRIYFVRDHLLGD